MGLSSGTSDLGGRLSGRRRPPGQHAGGAPPSAPREQRQPGRGVPVPTSSVRGAAASRTPPAGGRGTWIGRCAGDRWDLQIQKGAAVSFDYTRRRVLIWGKTYPELSSRYD